MELISFQIGNVFDVSQTEGEPLPELGVEELEGSVKDYGIFFQALREISPVPIRFEPMPGRKKGYYHLDEKRIAIKEGVSELQAVKTAVHEISHAKLHDPDTLKKQGIQVKIRDENTMEVQAEGVAYVVSKYYSLDTSEYSFAYIAGWGSGREMKELKASLKTIQKTAYGLITDLDAKFLGLRKRFRKIPTVNPGRSIQKRI